MSEIISFEGKKIDNEVRHCRDLCEESLTQFVKNNQQFSNLTDDELEQLVYTFSYAFTAGYFNGKKEKK